MEGQSKFWWKSKKQEVAGAVFASFDRLVRFQNDKLESDRRNLKLYGKIRLSNTSNDMMLNIDFGRLKYNLIKSAIDTMESKISKNRPRPRFLTNRGDYSLKARAQKLEKFIEGFNYVQSTYQKTARALFDGYLMGTGYVKRIMGQDAIKLEHVPSYFMFVDEDDVIDGNPQVTYEARFISRETLKDWFPAKAIELEKVPSKVDPLFQNFLSNNIDPDVVLVLESFRVAGNNKKGRHVIAVEGDVLLLDEEWILNRAPYNYYPFKRRSAGFYGEGISEILTPIQVELNKSLMTKQEIIQFSKPKIMVQDGDTVIASHMNDEVGTILKYSGNVPPTSMPLLTVPIDLDQHIMWLIQTGYEQIGLNVQTATGQKPPELESGKALREFNDIETERFSMIAKSAEDFHMQIWKDLIEDMAILAKSNKKLSVTLLDRDGINKIDWAKIYLPPDNYAMQCYPSDLLGSTPAGKLADVKTMADMGMIDREQTFELLDFPDVNKFFQEAIAWKLSVEKVITEIVEESTYYPPDERSRHLEKQMEVMLSQYQIYQIDGLDQVKLDMMTRWIDEALAIQNQRIAEGQAQQNQMMQAQSEAQMAGQMMGQQGAIAPMGVATGEVGEPQIQEDLLTPEMAP